MHVYTCIHTTRPSMQIACTYAYSLLRQSYKCRVYTFFFSLYTACFLFVHGSFGVFDFFFFFCLPIYEVGCVRFEWWVVSLCRALISWAAVDTWVYGDWIFIIFCFFNKIVYRVEILIRIEKKTFLSYFLEVSFLTPKMSSTHTLLLFWWKKYQKHGMSPENKIKLKVVWKRILQFLINSFLSTGRRNFTALVKFSNASLLHFGIYSLKIFKKIYRMM